MCFKKEIFNFLGKILKQSGEMKFDVTSLYIQKNYGMALVALGFINFIYPD